MITREQLLIAICDQTRSAKEAFPDQDVVSECLEQILHCCKDSAFVDEDKEALNTIERYCNKAQAIIKSDSPDQTAFVDCLNQIMNKAQEKLKER